MDFSKTEPIMDSPANNYSSPQNDTASFSNKESLEFKSIKVFFYFLILLCSTFGNGMVAYIICTTRRMRTASNYLILNLAICDVLTPVISIPFDYALELNGYTWPYGGFLCKVLWPAATLTATSSSLTLAVISLDRYRLIMHPFKPRLTSNQIKVSIVCVHVFGAILVAPYVSMLRLQNDVCTEFWPNFIYRQYYTLVLFLVQYGLPLPFMIVMYALALKNLYRSARKTSVMQSIPFRVPPVSKNEKEKKEKRKYNQSHANETEANKRATRMFLIVVSVFTIFMLPNQVAWLWADFGNGLTKPGFLKAVIVCWLFTYTNSVLNPIIFTVFSRDFRNGFKNIFRRLCIKLLPDGEQNRRQHNPSARPTGNTMDTSASNGFATLSTIQFDGSLSETVL